MYVFLLPLLAGFLLNSASAFTTFYSRRLGAARGRLACILLRDVLGIPLWAFGYILACSAASPHIYKSSLPTQVLGWVLILAGAAIIIAGMGVLRWKAVAPGMSDSLVENGLYAYLRHPLYAGMILELAGLFLWIPSLTVLVACLLGIMWAVVQSRLEEADLLLRIPAYKDYMSRVPGFVPKIRHP